MNEVQKLIEELTPFQDENFLTFPLYEEGNYKPVIKIWQILEKWSYPENFDFHIEFPWLPGNVSIDTEVVVYPQVKYDLQNLIEDFEDYIPEETGETLTRVTFEIYDNGDPIESADYNLIELLTTALNIIDFLKFIK
jgi:hypothetical protein